MDQEWAESEADSDGHTMLAIACPHCGAYTERLLPVLRAAEALACDGCGAAIDIRSGECRTLIDRVAALCRRLDQRFKRKY